MTKNLGLIYVVQELYIVMLNSDKVFFNPVFCNNIYELEI